MLVDGRFSLGTIVGLGQVMLDANTINTRTLNTELKLYKTKQNIAGIKKPLLRRLHMNLKNYRHDPTLIHR